MPEQTESVQESPDREAGVEDVIQGYDRYASAYFDAVRATAMPPTTVASAYTLQVQVQVQQ